MTLPTHGLRENAVMVSDFLTEGSSFTDASLHHLTAALKIRLKFSNLSYENKLIAVALTGNGTTKFYSSWSLKLNNDDVFSATKTAGTVKFNILNSPELENGTIYSVYGTVFPTTAYAGDANKITITVYTTQGYKTFDLTTESDMALEKGTYNVISKLCDMSALTANPTLGSGTANDPYIISTKAELTAVATNVNKGNSYSGEYLRMSNDIDLGQEEWTPIGSSSEYAFKGVFDGGGYDVKGLRITSNLRTYLGLFGYVSEATIKNLSVYGSIFITTREVYIGALAGYISNVKVENCHNYCGVRGNYITGGLIGSATSTDSGIKVSSCTNHGSVSSTATRLSCLGGIIGSDGSYPTNCSNFGTVAVTASTSDAYTGGISGRSYHGAINCANYGDVTLQYNSSSSSDYYVGGITGYSMHYEDNIGDVFNCVNYGKVTGLWTGSVGLKINVGGISGGVSTCWNCINNGDISGCLSTGGITACGDAVNCVNTGTVTKIYEIQNPAGAISGANDATVTDCYYLAGCYAETKHGTSKTKSEIIALANTLNSNAFTRNTEDPTTYLWNAWATTLSWPEPMYNVYPTSGGYEPSLWSAVASPNFSGGLGTSSTPYIISTAEELARIPVLITGGTNLEGVYFKLSNDIDLSGKEWIARSFKGVLDGNGYMIKGLYIKKSSNYQGLFSTISRKAIIKNLSVSGFVSGVSYVGGIVGFSSGSIINCYNYCQVNGTSIVGGIAGGQEGANFYNCGNYGEINASGEVVGGIIGESTFGMIVNCFNRGKITGSGYVGGVAGQHTEYGVTVENCYNAGLVYGAGINTGGLIGSSKSSTTTNCYYIKEKVYRYMSSSYVGIECGLGAGEDDIVGSVAGLTNVQFIGNTDISITINGELCDTFLKALNRGVYVYNESSSLYKAYSWSQEAGYYPEIISK